MLTSEQAQLLKLIGEKMATFRCGMFLMWDAATGEITEYPDKKVMLDEAMPRAAESDDGDSGDPDEEMNDD